MAAEFCFATSGRARSHHLLGLHGGVWHGRPMKHSAVPPSLCLLSLLTSVAVANAQSASPPEPAPAPKTASNRKTSPKTQAPATGATKASKPRTKQPTKAPSRAARLAERVCKSHASILETWMTNRTQLRGAKAKKQPTRKGYETYAGTQDAFGFDECLYFVEHGTPRYFCRSFLPKQQAVVLFKNLLAMITLCPGISKHLKLVYRKGDTAIWNSRDGSKRHSMWLDHNSLSKRPMTSLEFKSHRPSATARPAAVAGDKALCSAVAKLHETWVKRPNSLVGRRVGMSPDRYHVPKSYGLPEPFKCVARTIPYKRDHVTCTAPGAVYERLAATVRSCAELSGRFDGERRVANGLRWKARNLKWRHAMLVTRTRGAARVEILPL